MEFLASISYVSLPVIFATIGVYSFLSLATSDVLVNKNVYIMQPSYQHFQEENRIDNRTETILRKIKFRTTTKSYSSSPSSSSRSSETDETRKEIEKPFKLPSRLEFENKDKYGNKARGSVITAMLMLINMREIVVRFCDPSLSNFGRSEISQNLAVFLQDPENHLIPTFGENITNSSGDAVSILFDILRTVIMPCFADAVQQELARTFVFVTKSDVKKSVDISFQNSNQKKQQKQREGVQPGVVLLTTGATDSSDSQDDDEQDNNEAET